MTVLVCPHGWHLDRTEGAWHHAHTWQPCQPDARHGHVDWHDLTPLEARTVLAVNICAGTDRARDVEHRGVQVMRAEAYMRLYLSVGHDVTPRDVDHTLFRLAHRGAVTIERARDVGPADRLAGRDRIHPLAWPVPGGAPW